MSDLKVEPGSPWSRVARAIPGIVVLIGLGALVFWGHHFGWSIPKFSALTGSKQIEGDDWCPEHGVPESQCVECNAELMPRQEYGWCKRHGIPNCPLEHAEVAQLKTRPRITAANLERAERALQFAKRTENSSKCKLYQRRIQFESAEAVDKAGIDVSPVWEAPVVEAVSANGQITYDQTRVARLSSRLRGTVRRVEKQVGETIRPGEVLALIEASEVGKAKGEFLSALAQADLKREALERLQTAYKKGAVPLTALQEAETAIREAEIRLMTVQQELVNLGLPIRAEEMKGLRPEEIAKRLQFLGLPEELTRTLDAKTTTANLLPVSVPRALAFADSRRSVHTEAGADFSGWVVFRDAVEGEVVDAAKVLFIVADTRQMWVTLDVRLEDAKQLALGQRVIFQPDGSDEESVGKINWISTAVDEKTRTIKVRADLDNSSGRLRSFTFGTGRIVLRQEKDAVVVPNEAIQNDGDCQIVFVRDKNYFVKDSPKVFHVRAIRPGARNGQFTEVAVGVLPGEVVATKGSGVLRSELLKNNLGEG